MTEPALREVFGNYLIQLGNHLVLVFIRVFGIISLLIRQEIAIVQG